MYTVDALFCCCVSKWKVLDTVKLIELCFNCVIKVFLITICVHVCDVCDMSKSRQISAIMCMTDNKVILFYTAAVLLVAIEFLIL